MVIIAMQITMRINLILISSKCSAIDIPDVDITMSENKQSRYNNYVDIRLRGSAQPVFIIKNELFF
jgi:hypothetical protein